MGTRLPLVLLATVVVAGCQIPRAKLHNLREVHSAEGAVRYRGNVQSDLAFALTRSFGNTPIRFEGLENFGGEDEAIEDPLEVDLDNLVELARMEIGDPVVDGIAIEAFGWLAVDDQYVLGRERAVLALGKHAGQLGLEGLIEAPAKPATPEEVSPVLATLARAGLGSLPTEVEGAVADLNATFGITAEVSLATAIEGVRGLALDREGNLRALAVTNILLERSDALHSGAAGVGLRTFAADLRRTICGLALREAAADESPVVRAACVIALRRLPGGVPEDSLKRFLADPSSVVSVEAFRHLTFEGPKLSADPVEAAAERDGWVRLLLAHAQIPEGRHATFACEALGSIAEAGFTSLRPEDWTEWWRATRPGEPLPDPGLGS